MYRIISDGSTFNNDKNSQRQKSKHNSLADDATAHELNDIFADVFSTRDIDSFEEASSFPPQLHTSDVIVTEAEVHSLLLKRKSNSAGADGVPGSFYRTFADLLSEPLTIIYNRAIQTSVFPSFWKLANIIPIPKANSLDFRPISILPFPSKILEIIIRDRLILPIISRQMDSRQFAFIPEKFGGCNNACLSIRLSILEHFTKISTNSVNLLTVDFRKAFDTVSHSKVLEILQNDFLCNSHIIKIVKSYLESRFQHVCTKTVTTHWRQVTSGVPQGSILGPLLFVTYINDLPQHKNAKIIAYADDLTVLHLTNVNDVDSNTEFQKIVDCISEWSTQKKLIINVKKTQILRIERNPSMNSDIILYDTPVEEVNSVRILGMNFTSDLRWSNQFSHIYKKSCRGLSIVKRLRLNHNSSNVILQAYKGLVFSQLSYSWPVLCDLNKVYFKKFEQLDRLAMKWANVSQSCVPSLRARLDSSCIRLIKKVSVHGENHPLSKFFVKRKNNNIRHTRTLMPFKRKSALYNNSFVRFSVFS